MQKLVSVTFLSALAVIGTVVIVNYITFRYPGICPPTIARAEFEKDMLFATLQGDHGHLGTEIIKLTLELEDLVCPVLGL